MTKTLAGASQPPGNIGPRGRRQRLVFGTITLALAGASLYLLYRWQAGRALRLALFPVIWLGLVGILQARARTCIALAARGTCDADAGVSMMTPALDGLFRQRAKTIRRTALALAAVLTLAALALP